MKSLSPTFLFPFFFSLLVQVSGLELLLQPQTVVGGTSVVFYTRDPSDPPTFTFDLHITSPDGTTTVDKGLAYPNIVVSPGQTTGAVPIIFPTAGTYTIQAVVPRAGQGVVISTSNVVTAVAPLVPVTPVPIVPSAQTPQLPVPIPPNQIPFQPPSATAPPLTPSVTPTPSAPSTSAPTPTPTSTTTSSLTSSLSTTSRSLSSTGTTSSHSQTSTSTNSHSSPHPTAPSNQNHNSPSQRKVNLPAVIGGVVGGLVFLGLLVALVIFLIRRKKDATKRYTFHQDMMVQPRNDAADPSAPRVTIVRGEAPSSFDRDLESGTPAPAPVTAPITAPVSAPSPAPKRVPSLPKKLILASSIASTRPERERPERPQSPMTPRVKRNFPDVTSNPFNSEAENFNLSTPAPVTPRTGIPTALTPGVQYSVPLPSSFKVEPFNPFQDSYKAEPEMTQVPPSPRVPNSAVVIPSPRGPRPSISRRPGGSSEGSSSSSHTTA